MTGRRHSRRWIPEPPRRLVDEPAWPDKPMALPSTRQWRDVPWRAFERVQASLMGRNPPAPPWRRRAGHAWQTTVTGPRRVHATDHPVFGLIAAWNEEDVIWSTVRHLFRQGCDTVIVLDDDSTDATVAEAEAAGAVVRRRPPTARWLESERCAAINEVIVSETAAVGSPVWWLVTDADEFPVASGSIKQLVRSLPPEVDVVGSEVWEHYPNPGVEWEHRMDPLDAPGRVCAYPSDYCPQGHWKHQLFLSRVPGDLRVMPGAHTLASRFGDRVREWHQPITMHHVPFRDLDRLEQRISGVRDGSGRYGTTPDSFTVWRARQRLQVIERLRQGRWDELPNSFPGQRRDRLSLRPWPGRPGARR